MNRAVVALLAALMVALAAPAGAEETLPSPQPPATPPAGSFHDAEDCEGSEADVVRVAARRPAAGPVGVGSCTGVRPGARVVVAGQGVCTLNFAFTGRDRQGVTHRYMGTAGHCAVPAKVQRAWRGGGGPVVTDAAGQRIGRFAYAIHNGDRDFGLIRLDPGVRASARMCHFGGPTGVNHDLTSRMTTLRYYGMGLGVDRLLPARTAVAQGMPHEGHVHAFGAATFGDSGAGVVSADGRAVGLIITVGVHGGRIGTSGMDTGTVGIARLGPVVRRASTALQQRLTLHTAPLR